MIAAHARSFTWRDFNLSSEADQHGARRCHSVMTSLQWLLLLSYECFIDFETQLMPFNQPTSTARFDIKRSMSITSGFIKNWLINIYKTAIVRVHATALLHTMAFASMYSGQWISGTAHNCSLTS